MAAKTPPDKYLPNWASLPSGRKTTGEAKKAAGSKIGEAPGAEHLNYIYNLTGAWNEVAGRTLAAKMAMRNIEYTTISIGPAQVVDSMHIDYFDNADHWYCTGIDTSGNMYANDSADGETWSTTVYPANVGGGSTGDTTKFATNGTICAVAADSGGQAKVFVSSDLTVANLDAGNNVDNATNSLESSDLTYDADNGLWIWVGRSTTQARVYTATDPTGTWTNRTLPGVSATDVLSLASNDSGQSWLGTSTASQTYYSTNGTTWTLSTTDPAIANNVAWAPSLGLFVVMENATGDLWTSDDGGITWRDQTAINSTPPLWNMVHCPDFVLGWTTKTASTNTIDYSGLYAWHTMATDADSYCYQKIGQAWGDTLPYVSRLDGVFRGGQGKIIFPYTHATPTNDTYLAIARYGAT